MATRETLKSHFNTGDTPTEAQFALLIDSLVNAEEDGHLRVEPAAAGRKRTAHFAVIRYSSALGRWATLDEIDGSHAAIGIDSVASDDTRITVGWDLTDHGANPTVVWGNCSPDETLAREGVTCGPSIANDEMRIEIAKRGVVDFVTHNGPGNDDWSSSRGVFSAFAWDAAGDRLLCTLDVPDRVIKPTILPTTQFVVSGRNVKAGFDGGSTGTNELRVQFYPHGSATKMATPTGSPTFTIYCPEYSTRLRPNSDFPGALENIWLAAVIESDI